MKIEYLQLMQFSILRIF